MRRRPLAIVALGTALVAQAAAAPPPPDRRVEMDAAQAEAARTAREYRDALARVLALREAEVRHAEKTLVDRRELAERGLIARADVTGAQRALVDVRRRAAEVRTEIGAAETLVAEAEAERQLAAAPPPPPGEVLATPTLVRYAGTLRPSPAHFARLERFFEERFGRPLPVSALGQTPVHDRLGFDHRNAIDVAVHPETAEGDAVTTWLRDHGVPFLAFRGAVAGAATGAHVHVGDPSRRLR